MPLSTKGETILGAMRKTYHSAKKAKRVFYSSINSGRIKGAEKSRRRARTVIDSAPSPLDDGGQ